jgi:hypothetical protein
MFQELICPKCGKNFIKAPQHLYRDEKHFYCSWTCYNHRNDKKAPKKFKKVGQYTLDGKLIKTYPSANDAAETIGLSVKCIRNACREQSTYFGYLWRYENDLP